jgi:FG-GAP-like repeat/FG-GAP repeat
MARNARPFLLGVIVLSTAIAAVATHFHLIEYTGTGTDHLGAACAFGDVTGDGVPDVVVGTDGGDYVDVYDGANPASRIHRFTGGSGDAFGSALATGDLDADSIDDVVIGAYSWDGPAGTDQGYVEAYSGASGLLLFRLEGVKLTDTFGASLAVRDLTGDGWGELLVGAPFADKRGTNNNSGYVKLFDGKTLDELFRWDGPEAYDEMGRSVAFGDVNGDDQADIILGAGSGNRTDYGGYVWVMNGLSFGQRLFSFTDGKAHVKPEQNFGFAVAASDVNGDGRADVIVGAYRGQSGPLRTDPATGYIRVFDGATGAQLYQVNSDFNGEQFGRAVAAADLTGDGRADIVGGARWGATGGHVFVIDGPTGTVIHRQDANVDFEWLGASVAATDGGANGTPRFAAGAYQGDSRSPNPGGYVRVWDFIPPP